MKDIELLDPKKHRTEKRRQRVNHLVKVLRDQIPADFEEILSELHLLALGGDP